MITNRSEKQVFLTTNEVPVFGGNRLQTNTTHKDKVTTLNISEVNS